MPQPPKYLGVPYGLGAAVPGYGYTDAGAANTVLAVTAANTPPVFTATPTVTGLTTSGLTVNGDAAVNGTLSITPPGGTASAIVLFPFGTSAGETSELRFRELTANGSNRVAVKAPDALAANWTWTWPDAAPTANGQVLSGTTAGVTSWIAPPARGVLQFMSVSIQLDTAATRYFGAFLSATETDVEIPVPFTGTLRNLFVRTALDPDAGAGTQSYAFTLRRNTVDTALVCTVTQGTRQGSDTTHTVAVTQGDSLTIKGVPANTPTATAVMATVELFA